MFVPLSSDYKDIGPASVPQDIKRLRREVLDYFQKLGQPVIFKHKWTNDDVEAGLAEYCPYCFNTAYKQPSQVDPYCFGTGYLGGFAAGVIVFVTLGDTARDSFTLTEQGVLMKDNHPTCSAPWQPYFQDGDLLITGSFDPDLWDIRGLSDRYIVREVNGVNLRGSRPQRDINLYQVSQQFQVDEIQAEHPYWNVPVIFDTADLPPTPTIPPGSDPDDFGGPQISTTELIVTMPVATEAGRVTITFPED